MRRLYVSNRGEQILNAITFSRQCYIKTKLQTTRNGNRTRYQCWTFPITLSGSDLMLKPENAKQKQNKLLTSNALGICQSHGSGTLKVCSRKLSIFSAGDIVIIANDSYPIRLLFEPPEQVLILIAQSFAFATSICGLLCYSSLLEFGNLLRCHCHKYIFAIFILEEGSFKWYYYQFLLEPLIFTP